MDRTDDSPLTTSLPLDDIAVGGRARKDLRDIPALMASIQSVGLLHPVVVDAGRNLIAGGRRLEAVKRLGWSEVPVRVAAGVDDALKSLIAERDENTCREPLTPEEMVELGRRIEALEKPKAAERKAANLKKGVDTPKGQISTSEGGGKTRDKVAAAVGVSGKTYEKAKKVVEAAEKNPGKFRPVVDRMNATGKIDPAYREIVVTETPAPPRPASITVVVGDGEPGSPGPWDSLPEWQPETPPASPPPPAQPPPPSWADAVTALGVVVDFFGQATLPPLPTRKHGDKLIGRAQKQVAKLIDAGGVQGINMRLLRAIFARNHSANAEEPPTARPEAQKAAG